MKPFLGLACMHASVFREDDAVSSVVLKKEIDTEEEVVERPRESLPKKEILRGYSQLEPIYEEVEKFVKSLGDDVRENTLGDQEVQFKRRKIFMVARFRKRKGLMLDMDAGEDVTSPRFKHWRDSPWGYVHVNSINELDGEVKSWIKKAYERCT